MKLSKNNLETLKALSFLMLIAVGLWFSAGYFEKQQKKEDAAKQAMAEYYFLHGEYFGELELLNFQINKKRIDPENDFKVFYSDPKNRL